MKSLFIKSVATALFLGTWITPLSAETPKNETPKEYPEFSWDKVPLAIHFGRKYGVMTEEEVKYAANRASLFTFEKAHGFDTLGSAEKGISYDAKRLKEVNPDLTVLYYWNLFVKYDFYEAMGEVQPNWLLRTNADEVIKKLGRRELFDVLNSDMRNWWSSTGGQAMKDSHCDGIFVDAVKQPAVWYPRSKYGHPVDDTKLLEKVEDSVNLMLADVKEEAGKDSMIIFSGMTSTKDRPAHGKRFLDHTDGGIFGFFTALKSKDPEAIAHDIATIQEAGKRGKITVVKGWPSTGLYFRDTEKMRQSEESLIQEAKDYINFSLACYLIAAQPYSYFCYSWGYCERSDIRNMGSFVEYPELQKPLGEPKGEATKEGFKYKRSFKHANVTVDLETREAEIEWLN